MRLTSQDRRAQEPSFNAPTNQPNDPHKLTQKESKIMSYRPLLVDSNSTITRALVASVAAVLLGACSVSDTPLAETQSAPQVISELSKPSATPSVPGLGYDLQNHIEDISETDEFDATIPIEDSYAGRTPFGAYVASGPKDARDQYNQRVADGVTRCMAELGFNYSNEVAAPLLLEADQLILTDLEWIEAYGYGVSTRYEQELRQVTSLPQYTHFLKLSESEKMVTNAALNGDDDGPGCKSQGAWNALSLEEVEALTILSREYKLMDVEVPPEFSLIAPNLDWQACMQGKGEYFNSPDEALDYVINYTDMVRSSITLAGQQVTSGDSELIEYGISVASGEIKTKEGGTLAFIQSHEISIAVADMECRVLHYTDIDDRRIDGQNRLLAAYPEEAKVLWLVGNILELR